MVSPSEVLPEHRKKAWSLYTALLVGFIVFVIFIIISAIKEREAPPTKASVQQISNWPKKSTLSFQNELPAIFVCSPGGALRIKFKTATCKFLPPKVRGHKQRTRGNCEGNAGNTTSGTGIDLRQFGAAGMEYLQPEYTKGSLNFSADDLALFDATGGFIDWWSTYNPDVYNPYDFYTSSGFYFSPDSPFFDDFVSSSGDFQPPPLPPLPDPSSSTGDASSSSTGRRRLLSVEEVESAQAAGRKLLVTKVARPAFSCVQLNTQKGFRFEDRRTKMAVRLEGELYRTDNDTLTPKAFTVYFTDHAHIFEDEYTDVYTVPFSDAKLSYTPEIRIPLDSSPQVTYDVRVSTTESVNAPPSTDATDTLLPGEVYLGSFGFDWTILPGSQSVNVAEDVDPTNVSALLGQIAGFFNYVGLIFGIFWLPASPAYFKWRFDKTDYSEGPPKPRNTVVAKEAEMASMSNAPAASQQQVQVQMIPPQQVVVVQPAPTMVVQEVQAQ